MTRCLTRSSCAPSKRTLGLALVFDRDDDVRESGLYTLAEQSLLHRKGYVQRVRVRMLERERVEQAEEAVGDHDRVDLVPQELPGSERRVDPGVLDPLRVEGNADPLDLGHSLAVEQVLHARAPPVA